MMIENGTLIVILVVGVVSAVLLTYYFSRRFLLNGKNKVSTMPLAVSELELAVAAANMIMWSFDVKKKAVTFSDEFENVLGYPPTEFANNLFSRKRVDNLVEPQSLDTAYKSYSTHINGESEWLSFEPRIRHINGEYIDFLVRGKIVGRDSKGGALRLEGVLLDISDRKNSERMLRLAREEAEKNGEYLQRALEQARILNSQARVSDTARKRFMMNMSHELRTPLTSIMGWTDVLLDSGLEPTATEQLECIRQSSEHLLLVINNLLDVSQIQVDSISIEGEEFDLVTLLDEMAAHQAIRATDKAVELVVRIGPTVPRFIRGDKGRLSQILVNIIDNAVKFTKSGDVVIDVSVEDETKSEVSLKFSVRDTGIGIAPDQLEMIFDSFTQVDDSSTRLYGGVGLGLSISKSFVEVLGGQIEVRTNEGVGSEFSFAIKFEKQERLQSVAKVVPQEFLGKRMLIVDDNQESINVIMELGGFWGFSVESATNAQIALEKLHAAEPPFDLVLIDDEMPGSGGDLLAAMIRIEPKLGNTTLVFMGPAIQKKTKEKLGKDGFDSVVNKPVVGPRLYACLEEVFSNNTNILIKNRKNEVQIKPGNIRILLVEDNDLNREMIVAMIGSLGYKVDGVESGRDAINALCQITYNLVFMDIQMPRMDGLETTHRIRAKGSEVRNSSVPIVALTAHASEQDQKNCLEVGMNDFLSKPVALEVLDSTIHKWVGNEVFAQRVGEG